ncbi:MAG: ThuA domain-containing protein [Candidatus Nealsonbacteria bacterium]|nr:ThuA domain-containing protein [Candidatus Nealsonbacteria bacterium]
MKRREMLAATGAAVAGLSGFPLGWAAEPEKKKRKLLYFTRSIAYEHSVIAPGADGLSHSGKVLAELGEKHGFEIEPSKDGSIFDGDLDAYDALVFYTCGDLYTPSVRKTPPMSPEGRKRLIAAVAAGKPFVALHSACYWGAKPAVDDAYLEMVGAGFVAHGAQQKSTMKVTSPGFPGADGLGDSFDLVDEWYALKNFSKDLHVILAEDNEGMKGGMYQRPPFPSTWARMHGKGRVFFSAMGHREDVWTNATFQKILLGGLAWALGDVDADLTPNVDKVTPNADQLTK